jgi:hypothetical protein
MKYAIDIIINAPIEKVTELFDNHEKRGEWMKGLISSDLISGKQGQAGAKTKLKFKMGKREMEMTETIISRNFPDDFTVAYEAKGVYNIVISRFEKVDENTTRYINDQEFRFKGFMKIMAFLMPGAFKKQSKKYLADFKTFIEKYA